MKDCPDFNPALKLKNAAEYLSIHPESLRLLAREGKITSSRPTGPKGSLRFQIADLNAWLEAGKAQATA